MWYFYVSMVVFSFMSIAYRLAFMVCSQLTFHILIFFSRTTKPNWTKHRCDIHWMVLFLNCVQWHCSTSKDGCHEFWLVKNFTFLKIFFRTTKWNETKLYQLTRSIIQDDCQHYLKFLRSVLTDILKLKLQVKLDFYVLDFNRSIVMTFNYV